LVEAHGTYFTSSEADDTSIAWLEAGALLLNGWRLHASHDVPDAVVTQDSQCDVRFCLLKAAEVDETCIIPASSLGKSTVTSAAISPDLSRFALILNNKDAELWTNSGERLGALGSRGWVLGAAFNKDGTSFALAQEGGLRFFSADGRHQRDVKVDGSQSDAIKSFDASPASGLIAVGIRHAVELYDWDGRHVRSLATSGYKVHRVRLSPDGNKLLSITDNPSGRPSYLAQFWSCEDGLIAALDAPDVNIGASIHYDVLDRYFVVWNEAGIRVFGTQGELIGVVPAPHNVPSKGYALAPDGNLVAVLFADRVVRVWSYDERRQVRSISVSSEGPTFFTRDGRHLLAAHPSGSFLQYPLDVTELYRGAARRLPRGFDAEEIARFGIQLPSRLEQSGLVQTP